MSVRKRLALSLVAAVGAILCVALVVYGVVEWRWHSLKEQMLSQLPAGAFDSSPAGPGNLKLINEPPAPTPTARPDIPAQPGVVRREDLVMQTRGDVIRLLNSGKVKVTLLETTTWSAVPNATGLIKLDDSWKVTAACFSSKNPGKVILEYMPHDDRLWQDDQFVAGVRSLGDSVPSRLGSDCDINKESLDLNAVS